MPFQHPKRTNFKTLNKVIQSLKRKAEKKTVFPLSSCAVLRLKPCLASLLSTKPMTTTTGSPRWNHRTKEAVHIVTWKGPEAHAWWAREEAYGAGTMWRQERCPRVC
ncbi:hypothetical protein ES332_D02G086800v1 [Gossypium tomentosum]|uniref:Uncharacterized protein n=1 Tax=Gossypium tomentosum TaxID=34277 RepID=A0A5D2LUT9_GOSTO|nr:hypothetical protein ES332_D02G086800v1 [Gossypium tomentosum]